jgi:hypothetical protein
VYIHLLVTIQCKLTAHGGKVEIIARTDSEICEVFVFVFESQSTELLTVLTGKIETEINVSLLFSDMVVKQAMPIGDLMPLGKEWWVLGIFDQIHFKRHVSKKHFLYKCPLEHNCYSLKINIVV